MSEEWLTKIKNGGILSEAELGDLCSKVIDLFSEENNLVNCSAPIKVVGDIHGQFYDLLELFRISGSIPTHKYIFMGDYVDRGYNSIETIEYLLTLKVLYPEHIILLRGNHESLQTSSVTF